MAQRGRKAQPGKGEMWEEPKTEKIYLCVTPTGRRLLEELAGENKTSKSEIVEMLVRDRGKENAFSLSLARSPEQKLKYGEVLKSLPDFSVSVLVEIARICFSLVTRSNYYPGVSNFGALLDITDAEALAKAAFVPLSKVLEVQQGKKGSEIFTEGELLRLTQKLAEAHGLETEVIEEIIDNHERKQQIAIRL